MTSTQGNSTVISDADSSAQGSDKKKKEKKASAADEGDILDEKKSAEEALFACMYALVKEKGQDSWQYSYAKVALEGLVSFIIVFNPSNSNWDIDTGNTFWEMIRWTVLRSPITESYGYGLYSSLVYVIAAFVFSILAGIGLQAWFMRKSDQSKWLKVLASVLQVTSDIMFSVFYMTVLDYLMFALACKYTSKPITHFFFTSVMCFEMPHMVVIVVSVLTATVFMISTISIQTAGCVLNPCARGILASPAAVMKIKVIITKSLLILTVNLLKFWLVPQALLMCVLAFYVFWLNFYYVPFFNDYITCIWCGMWLSVTYTTCIYAYLAFDGGDPNMNHKGTMMVLYGVWPVLLGGMLSTFLYKSRRMRSAAKFKDPSSMDMTKLKKVHRFSSVDEVELLCRVMRRFDLDGVIEPEAADLGELIIKAGLATFPNHPQLLILYSNFLMEIRKDGAASRTQLQIVSKHSPNFVQRYQIFCTVANSKRLKESTEHGGDLHSYVEFKKSYRAVLRYHKNALKQLRDLWRIMLKPDPRASKIEAAMMELSTVIDKCNRGYRKVIEQYPKNGKLLKVYGSFREDILNDFKGASRVYYEAARQGGTNNGILSMDFDFASQPGKPDMLLSMDVNEDAIVIINAEGQIMLVSQGVTSMFGYAKIELEGQNVSMLMPPPFSQRHAGYMQRYKDTGEARILDSMKEAVALSKERKVFPVQICVTKLSGVGDDAVFLGLLRPLPFSKRDIRAWIAPNGIILACGPMFSALTGILADEMVGANVKSMIADQEEFQKLLQEGVAASVADFDNSSLCRKVELINKYTEKIPCNVHLTLGGTDQNRMFVLHILRVEEVDDNLLVVNDEGSITFATIDLAVSLGYPLKSFMKLKLDQLLPPPINSMHEKFLIDAPPQYPVTSCRSGGVVNMVSSTNQQVPVRLKLSQREEQSGLKHIARITKCSPADFLDDRRMVIVATYDGLIESVETPKGSNPSPAIFGFPAAQLKGMSVCDVLDVFDDWRQRSGSTDMQLLMLALLDKDREMPGAAWRVKITPPEPSKGDQVVLLPAINAGRRSSWAAANAGNQNRRPPKSAIMQASMIDTNLQGQAEGLPDDGKPRVKLVLWRRELLVGSIELDPLLRVKRADVSAGLLMGRPVSTLLKQPLCRFLSIPKKISWDQMMDVSKSRKSVLKSGSTVSKVTAIKAFEGHHPDGGSMRIQIQGVMISDAMSGKSKIEIIIRPDLTFTAAHSNIWGALGLDGFGTKENNVTQESPEGDAHDSDGGKGSDREGGNQNDEDNNSDLSFNRGRGLQASLSGLSGKEETEERPSGGLVTNWMRTLSQQRRDAVLGMTDPHAPASPLRSPGKSRLAMDGPPSLRRGSLDVRTTGSPSGRRRSMDNPFGPDSRMSLDEGGPDKDMDWEKLAESMPDEAMSIPVKRHHHHHGAHQEAHGGGQQLVGEGGGADNASEDSMSEASSANGEGSVASSAVTGEAVEEILVDSRRGKVLRKLLALLQSKEMNTPISRLKIFTIVVISLFVAIRVICFAVLVTMLNTETRRLTELQDYSMASDRAQIVDSYVETIAFCKGLPNGTAPETICEDVVSLSAAANALLSNILDLEKGHQDSYLGVTGKPARPKDPNTYNVWSNTVNNVSLYLDTKPPLVVYEQRGMWELGNLYIAAARDAIYMTQYNTSTQMYSSRPRNFLLLNAPSSILWGYANLIDNFMVYVWNQLGGLEKANIALLVIESIVIIPLLCAWQWYLISKAERVRLVQWMMMVALPAPVLHTLSSRPVKIAEDSDDESDDENSEAEVETVGAPPDNKKAMPGGSQVMTPAGGKSQGPRSSLDPSSVGNRRSSLDVAGTGTRRGSMDISGGPKRTSLDVAGTGTRRGSMDFSGGPKRTSLDLAAGGGPGGKRRLSADLGGLQGDGDLSQSLQQIDEEGEGYEGGQVVTVKRGPKKMVAPSYKFTFIFVIPLVLWGIVVLVIYSLSQATIDGMKAPVAALNMLMHVIYRFSNMRLIALLMVTAGSDVSKNYWKAELVQSITNMTSEYNALMYGGNSVTQANQMFQQPSPASTFISASFSDLFFVDNECFRFNQSSCYTVNSTWYEATHHGLNSMMIRVLDELTLLTQDANPNITYTNPRFAAWYSIGVTDLYDGLQTSSQIFVNYGMTKYKGVQLMQIVLLIVCIVLAAMYLYWVLRPYLALQSDEVIKVAGLVSHVPHEVDARSHAKKVLRLMSAAPKKSKVQPGPNASTESEGQA